MKHRPIVVFGATLLTGLWPACATVFCGCRSADSAANKPDPPQVAAASHSPASISPAPAPPPPPAAVELSAGTRLTVSLDQDLGSRISRRGEIFNATVARAIFVNGHIAIPEGVRVDGTVIAARELGNSRPAAVLELRLEHVYTNWGVYPVKTGSILRAERMRARRESQGAVRAPLGKLVEFPAAGAVSSAAGAASGTEIVSAFIGETQILLPAQTLLTFRLGRPVHIVRD